MDKIEAALSKYYAVLTEAKNTLKAEIKDFLKENGLDGEVYSPVYKRKGVLSVENNCDGDTTIKFYPRKKDGAISNYSKSNVYPFNEEHILKQFQKAEEKGEKNE